MKSAVTELGAEKVEVVSDPHGRHRSVVIRFSDCDEFWLSKVEPRDVVERTDVKDTKVAIWFNGWKHTGS